MKYDLPDGFYLVPVEIQDGNEYILGGPVSIKDFVDEVINGLYNAIEFYFNTSKTQVEEKIVKDEYGIRETLG